MLSRTPLLRTLYWSERLPRSRRGKHSASVVVPPNPSSSIVADQSQKYPDVVQLHNLYPAPGSCSVAAHHIQLGSLYPALYNPPSFPIHGPGFLDAYAPSFQVHPQSIPSRVATPHRPFSSFPPSAAAGTWHSGLSLHSYYLVALPTNVKKCYRCGDMFAEKFGRHHTTLWSSRWIGVWYAWTTTQGRYCTAQTLPSQPYAH